MEMGQSPWKAYFGQMQKKSSSKQNGASRHPVIVALSVISVIFLIAAAFALRFNKWYFGKLSVTSICDDPGYTLPRQRPVVPIDDWMAYLVAFANPPILALLIEIIVLVVSLDKHDSEHNDELNPRPLKGPMLFMFRLLHFVAVHLLTLAFVSVLVDLAKIVFDWHRPYFLQDFSWLCEDNNDSGRSISQLELFARLGFPSHRLALLAAAAVLLSAHAIRALRNLRASGPFQSLIILAVLIPPILVSASVINSHISRPADVIVGLLIGSTSAAYTSKMLPSEISANNDEPAISHGVPLNTPATIEELNSVVPLRQALSWQFPRSPVTGPNNHNNRHTVVGYTARS